ncbi:MAG: trypsin-like peptidase domain-containing protein [Lachnospiraceae bacterium]|nr:trypsin-like peptidase domain-containing protein [Lachnospiraceae bacterium]
MYEDDNERREEMNESTPVVPRPHYTSYQYTSSPGAGVHIPEGPAPAQGPKNKKKKPGFFRKALVSVALGLIFGLCAGGAFYLVNVLTDTKTEAEADIPVSGKKEISVTETTDRISNGDKKITTTTAGSAKTTVTDVTKVAADVTPAVVAITNDMVITGTTWFGQEIQQQSEASGSGIIVGEDDDELLIVTNEHVVSDATTLSVQFVDGSVAEANFKGQDKAADIAVIAVEFDSLSQNTIDAIKIATLGDSESLEVGEPVIAIGNALGYGQSVTTGIVSALNRTIELDNGEHALIQTDAAINPGNSGGALLNIDGELIGINEAKAGGNGIEGMGYAIPISTARPIIEELMNKSTKKKVEEGKQAYLGIAGVAVARDVADTYDMPEGIYLAQVESGSPADEAGLKKGDIITKFDGQSVSSMEELKDLMQYYEAGEEVEVTVQTQKDGGYAEEKHTVKLGAKSET